MRHFLFFFEPDTEQKTVRIPVRGYNLLGLLMREDPGEHHTHVVRLSHELERGQLAAWHQDWLERFGGSKQIITFIDATERSYWQALERILANSHASEGLAIRAAIGGSTLLRPFEWTDRVLRVLKPLGSSHGYGSIRSAPRQQLEYRINRLVEQQVLPVGMMAERFSCRGVRPVVRTIRSLRATGVDHPIEVSVEGSVGGMGTVLVPASKDSTEELEQLFQESGERRYDIVVRLPLQIKWSVQYELDGRIRRIGMSEKRFVITPDGRDIHAASVMAERLTSISPAHIRQAERINRRILRDAISRGQGGSMGFVWRSVPGARHPELLWRTIRDESETVAHSLLRQLKRVHARAFVALHTRIFFRAFEWQDIQSRLGERLMCSLKHPTGAVLHVPYFKNTIEQQKGKRGIKTLLFITIGHTTEEAERISKKAIELLGAWRQGEKEK